MCTSSLAGKQQKVFFPTVWAPDVGKPTARVAAFKELVHNLLDNGT